MARPKKSAALRISSQIIVRFTDREARTVRAVAKKRRCSISTVIRSAVLNTFGVVVELKT